MRLTWIICCVLTGTCWAGCLAPRASSAGQSDVPLGAAEAQRIAEEFVPQLRGVLGPGKTTLVLTLDIQEPLRAALEREARRQGYAVAEVNGEPGAIMLSCALDRIAARQFRVTMRAGDTLEVSRAYGTVEDGKTTPLTQFTRRWETDTEPAEGFPLPDARREIARDAAKARRSESLGIVFRPRTPPSEASVVQPQQIPAAVRLSGSRDTEAGRDSVVAPSPVPVAAAAACPQPATTQEASVVEEDDAIVLSPNGEHVIEISGALFANVDGVANPFLQQYQPKVPAHELTLSIGGVVMGPNPTAVLNGRVRSIGESIEGFRVEGIQRDLVTLRWENFTLRIPVAQQSVVVRYP